jgi:hypothetical protein
MIQQVHVGSGYDDSGYDDSCQPLHLACYFFSQETLVYKASEMLIQHGAKVDVVHKYCDYEDNDIFKVWKGTWWWRELGGISNTDFTRTLALFS